jgi:hypothetical protein
MRTSLWKRISLLGLLLIAATAVAPSYGQINEQYAIERAQNAIRERIGRENGFNYDVTFPDQPQTYSVSNALTGVRGRGMFAPRDNYRNARNFVYDVVVNVRNGNIDRLDYRLNDGGGGGGGNDDTVPSWLVGTYRGRNPSTRQDMTLIINRRGRIRAVYDSGGTDRGDYVNGRIQLGNSLTWDISQSGRDLRVRDARTGRSERFKRTSDSEGEEDFPGDSDRVPQWMVGTFRGYTDSGESELSIARDGSAIARSLTTSRSFYGRYENGRLTFEFGSYDVQRDGNGIRTVNLNNRRDQTSYRRIPESRR